MCCHGARARTSFTALVFSTGDFCPCTQGHTASVWPGVYTQEGGLLCFGASAQSCGHLLSMSEEDEEEK